MSASDQASHAAPRASSHWIANQPYLLLCITALCWAGNAIVGRLAAGHIPPVTLSFLRWGIAFLLILPFAWKHLKRDWPAIRGKIGIMILVSITGIGVFNTLQYWALEYTQALNTLLLQSAGPLVVAVWSLLLLGVRLTLAQAIGVLVSLMGVLVILMHGDLTALKNIQFNKGDLIFLVAMVIFALYSVLTLKRPAIHRHRPQREKRQLALGKHRHRLLRRVRPRPGQQGRRHQSHERAGHRKRQGNRPVIDIAKRCHEQKAKQRRMECERRQTRPMG